MDRIQPVELEGHLKNVEAFGETQQDVHDQKTVAERRRNEKIKPIHINIEGPEGEPGTVPEVKGQPEKTPGPSILVRASPSEIIISPQFECPFTTFEYLSDISTFVMTRTGPHTAEITTTSNLGLFKCTFPETSYWEGCQPEAREKVTKICAYEDSSPVMHLRHVLAPCHACFEEESNRIEIFGSDESLIATILQKKTWIGSRVDREILIEPGPYGKSNTYAASFTWNDPSVNFKANRSGIIVATLMTDCVEKGRESNYVLHILRDICPRDKAMLVAFMLARADRPT